MPIWAWLASRIRMTVFSPNRVGRVLTRKSMVRVADMIRRMRPSCGTRFSEMSSFGEHLDARYQLFADRDGRLGVFAQHTVDPQADPVEFFKRLEMDVGGAHRHRGPSGSC